MFDLLRERDLAGNTPLMLSASNPLTGFLETFLHLGASGTFAALAF